MKEYLKLNVGDEIQTISDTDIWKVVSIGRKMYRCKCIRNSKDRLWYIGQVTSWMGDTSVFFVVKSKSLKFSNLYQKLLS